jgi:cell fate regulator YaaT (PSP1 superfamily)
MKKLEESRLRERDTMVRARAVARQLGLEMKIGDVEFQGDGRKATFYYTSDDRVDFRELIKVYAKEFHVKIEMHQIGARQEAGRIGGIGSCGRELCCSTWLTDFKNVGTAAARYQQLSINQAKLSGQCGRLKCCLNYELDTYMDALKDFPSDIDKIETETGIAYLQKTDIFKRLMWFAYKNSTAIHPLTPERVHEISALNKNGQKPTDLGEIKLTTQKEKEPIEYTDVVGQVSLNTLENKAKKKKKHKHRHKHFPPKPKRS